MTEPPSHRPDDPSPATPVPLGYAPARPGTAARAGQVVAGAVMATVVFLGLAFVAPVALGGSGMLIGPLVGIILLVPLALRLRRNPLYRPWSAGIWIGLGVGLLTDGLCWAFLQGMGS